MASKRKTKENPEFSGDNGSTLARNGADTHEIVDGSYRLPLEGAKVIGPVNSNQIIEVTLKLRRKTKLPKITERTKPVTDRDGFFAKYGASQADVDKVENIFQGFGLQVSEENLPSRRVVLSGTVAAMEKAFQVRLFNFTHLLGNYRGRVGNVHVPNAVSDIVIGVFGLDNRRIARRRKKPMDGVTFPRDISNVPSSWYTSGELAAHYNYPPGDGAGQTIGLLEFGGGYFESDLQQYCALAQIAMPNVQPISVDGTSTTSDDDAAGEVMLDVEVVAGVCPKATINVYFANGNDASWIAALDRAVQDNVGVISISWGAPEGTPDLWTAQATTNFDDTLQDAAHLGVTVCVASGDDGSSDADMDGNAHVDYPSASQYALAVGGTTIPTKGGNTPDIVWFEGDGLRADNGGSTGGGVSAVTPRPSWQSAIAISSVNPGGLVGRVIPDLSANADWTASPYLLVVNGGAQANGGTSAASPLVAALITLINAQRDPNNRVGYLTPALYQAAAAGGQTIGAVSCTDVVSGNNTTAQTGGYPAGIGYDAASGWGTPNGANLLQALQNI